MKYEIINQNCLHGMSEIPDKSISLVLTDPPYFFDGMGDDWNNKKLHKRIKDGVIGGLPAGMKYDKQQGIDLYFFMKNVSYEWYRVCKPGAFVLCFTAPRLAHKMASAIEDVGFDIRDTYAWLRRGQPKAFSQKHFVHKMGLTDEEKSDIMNSIGDRKTPQLKPDMELIVMAQKPKEGTYVNNWMKYETSLINVENYLDPYSFPSTVIVADRAKEKFGHLTPKPVKLLRHLIRIFCKSGDSHTVLDSFAGTGSTAIAAYEEGNTFVGFEIDSDMCEIANNRLNQHIGGGK